MRHTPYAIALAACLTAFSCTARADEPKHPTDAEIVGQFIDDSTFLVIKAELSRPDVQTGVDRLVDRLPHLVGNIDWARTRLPQELDAWLETTQGRPSYVLFNARGPGGVNPPVGDVDQSLPLLLREPNNVFLAIVPDAEGNLPEYERNLKVTPRPEIAKAFDAVKEFPVQMLLLPQPHARRAIEEMMPVLPDFLGGGPSAVLTEGFQWGAVGFDPKTLAIKAVIQSESPDAAQAFSQRLPGFMLGVYMLTTGRIERNAPFPMIEAVLLAATPRQIDGSRIIVDLTDTDLPVNVLEQIGTLVTHGLETDTRNKMKQILLAMHNHHDTYKCFPVQEKYRDENGRPYLSWRVHLLPYLEQYDLYKQFHLDEPWDSEHNKKLIDKMPIIYLTADSRAKPGHTTLLAPVGEGTAFGQDEPIGLVHIRDGSSNTIALVEVKDDLAVPWTKPADYEFDPDEPGKGLRVFQDGTVDTAFFDGSVHRFLLEKNVDQLLKLFQMDDRQPVSIK